MKVSIKLSAVILSLILMLISVSCAKTEIKTENTNEPSGGNSYTPIVYEFSEDGKSFQFSRYVYPEMYIDEGFHPQFYFSDGKLYWNMDDGVAPELSSWNELGELEAFTPTKENFDSLIGGNNAVRFRQSIRYAKKISFEFNKEKYNLIFLFKKSGEVLVCNISEDDTPRISGIESYYADNTSTISPLYFGCLNSAKLSISSVRHIPIFKFDGEKAISEFYAEYSDALPKISINENETYFAAYIPSYDKNYKLYDIAVGNGSFIAYITETNEENNMYNGEMLLFSVKKEFISDCTSFDAVLNFDDEE